MRSKRGRGLLCSPCTGWVTPSLSSEDGFARNSFAPVEEPKHPAEEAGHQSGSAGPILLVEANGQSRQVCFRCLSCRNRLLSSAELRLFHHMSRQRLSQTAVRFCRHWHISRSPPQAQPSSCMVAIFTLTSGAGSSQCSPEEVRSHTKSTCHCGAVHLCQRCAISLGNGLNFEEGRPWDPRYTAALEGRWVRVTVPYILDKGPAHVPRSSGSFWLVLCMLLRRALLCLGESGRGVAAPCQGLCEQ